MSTRKNLRRPGTTKAAKASAKAVTASAIAKATKAKPAARPGVIAYVIALISRPQGCTVAEAKPLLAKKFPERSPDSMANTFALNMHLFAFRRAQVAGRTGTVFYGKGGK